MSWGGGESPKKTGEFPEKKGKVPLEGKKMANRLPPELHLVHGTKAAHNATPLPEKVRQRIPKATWLDDPDSWDRNTFIAETADFLWETYGIGSDQDKHILAALATQIDIYVKCWKGVQKGGVITQFNNGQTVGPNPFLTAGDKALARAIVLMNELGLTPRGRLATNKQEGGKYSRLLNGP
jgi:P27 family predicted phage terminase small subunit